MCTWVPDALSSSIRPPRGLAFTLPPSLPGQCLLARCCGSLRLGHLLLEMPLVSRVSIFSGYFQARVPGVLG